MKKKILVAMFAAAMAALALTPVSASAAGSGFYAVGKAGAVFPSDGDYNTGFSGDIGIGYDLISGSGLLGIEATVGYLESSGEGNGAKSDVDIVPFALTVKAGGKIANKTRLYVGAGLDLVYVSANVTGSGRYNGGSLRVDGSDSDTVFGGHVLGGITFDITDQIFLGLEGKYLWSNEAKVSIPASIYYSTTMERGRFQFTQDINNFTLMAMVGFRF